MNATPSPLRRFLDLTGGSLLYCLSALSILYGITRILGPLLVESASLREALPCVGALNLYELALLGALAFIVVCRRVTDDAISLMVLIPLFLVGSGIALDTVAGKAPAWAVGLGAACAAVGMGKLEVLRRKIGLPLGRLAMAGLGLVVLWNFLAGPALRWIIEDHGVSPAIRRSLWLGSLLLILIGGGLFLAGITRAGARGKTEAEGPRPFISTPPMSCVFALVLFAAAGAHLYALGYVFNVIMAGGDFLLLGTLAALLLMEALMYPGNRRLGVAACVACAPMAVALAGLASRGFFTAPFEGSLELLGHPSVIFGLTGAAAAWTAFRTRWAGFFIVAGAYAIGMVLTFDVAEWRYVILSFLLLGVGVWRSSVKGRGPIPGEATLPTGA